MNPDALLESTRGVVTWLLHAFEVPVLVYFLVINTSYLLLILMAAGGFVAHLRRLEHAGREETVSSQLAPGVSLLVPAYNEAAGIVPSVQAMLALRYPRHEIVVIDDGSTDDTFERLREAFDLVRVDRELPRDVPVKARVIDVWVPRDGRTRLVAVRKENSGKTDALNVGINAASEPLVAMVDADSLLDPDALLTVAKPFADDPIRTVATGGVVRAANGCTVVAGRIVEIRTPRQWLPRVQIVEYLRAFLLGRTGWSRMGALILISGAFGLFRRDVLVEVQGLDTDSIGEDFELVMRIHRHMRRAKRDYRVEFVSEPVSWTEVPANLTVLRSQRRRWHRGLWEVLWKYRGMVLNPRYGRIGMIALPWYWVFELLAPALELAGIVLVPLGLALGLVNVRFALLFVLVAYGYAIVVTLAAMAVEELSFHKYPRWRDLGATLLASVAENLGYRQLTAWWRVEGWWAGLRRGTHVWGTMTRQGFAGADGGQQ
ncbi:glycosyltransferase family 2 protein [Oryzihumus leptocrescens]|uniref:Cellulose synthase/poly-beta-1,6-N-acetylglucosamine synthase-like glycosyltransferase n=1 Tax=Oryzihumus leptocrescens TaxID=297536 RepID=A0A542ZLU9_9MICO|nr:glycosyltransferase family 2 protein [Oryzihumus leptocrescens]TQL61342.1 cellulose synthase/poly-beta-1,6-N-acetylglucosamine synthase-like glycosyltransferase [Oryzihumus leptocrescens]